MIKVQSSNIDSVDHDGKTLTVTFKSGTTWSYHGVPFNVYHKMLAAESIGGYFAKHIKDSYKGTKHDG